MTSLLQFINDSGLVGWAIIFVGVAGLSIITERAYMLYKKYSLNADEFMTRIQTLVLAKRHDEALLLCSQMPEKPLPAAFKTILEKSDRDDDALYQAHDIALSETIPVVTKRLHYLSMLANVATLMGLLGTIHGLIVSFEAVAQADPSQKQAMLAHGISISMYTTALGLVVAIPVMIAYSFLVSKQNDIVDQLTEKCGKLTELITGSHIPSLSRDSVFTEKTPKAPPTNLKAQ